MYFNKLVSIVLNEHNTYKIVPTFNGDRLGYITSIIYFNDEAGDMYENGKYPAVYNVYEIDSVLGWEEFDEIADDTENIFTICITNEFEIAHLAFTKYLQQCYPLLSREKKQEILQQIDRLSEVRGIFKVYESGRTNLPFAAFSVEADNGFYRAQALHNDFQAARDAGEFEGLDDIL
jgi:hypothetical protein